MAYRRYIMTKNRLDFSTESSFNVGLEFESSKAESDKAIVNEKPTWVHLSDRGNEQVNVLVLTELLCEENNICYDQVGNTSYYYSDELEHYLRLSKGEYGSMLKRVVANYSSILFKPELVDKSYRTIQYCAVKLIEIKENGFHIEGLINMDNILLDPKTMKQYKHSSKFFTLSRLDVSYVGESSQRYFLDFLEQITLGDEQMKKLLQEVAGYLVCHTSSVKLEKIFILYGSGGNSKGVFSELIVGLISKESQTNFSLPELNVPFNRSMLVSSLVNFSSEEEESKKGIASSIVKKITSGDSITCDVKYSSPYSFEAKVKLLINMNSMIRLEVTPAILRRLLIIPFRLKLSKDDMDVHMSEKLRTDREYVFKWCLDGYQRLIRNDYKLSHCDAVDEMIEQFKSDNSIVSDYVLERLEYDVESRFTFKELYDDFSIYATQNRISNRFDSVSLRREIIRVLDAEDIPYKKFKSNATRGLKYIRLKKSEGKYPINN